MSINLLLMSIDLLFWTKIYHVPLVFTGNIFVYSVLNASFVKSFLILTSEIISSIYALPLFDLNYKT